MDLTPVPQDQRGSLSTGVRWSIRPRLDSDGRYGRIEAVDLTTRKPLWTERQRAPQSSGVLATAGGLVFSGGTPDRYFRAFDAATGEVLWQQRTSSGVTGIPTTYSVDGTQYVAVQSGWGIDSRGMQGRLNIARPGEFPEVPEGGSIWVFALPR